MNSHLPLSDETGPGGLLTCLLGGLPAVLLTSSNMNYCSILWSSLVDHSIWSRLRHWTTLLTRGCVLQSSCDSRMCSSGNCFLFAQIRAVWAESVDRILSRSRSRFSANSNLGCCANSSNRNFQEASSQEPNFSSKKPQDRSKPNQLSVTVKHRPSFYLQAQRLSDMCPGIILQYWGVHYEGGGNAVHGGIGALL